MIFFIIWLLFGVINARLFWIYGIRDEVYSQGGLSLTDIFKIAMIFGFGFCFGPFATPAVMIEYREQLGFNKIVIEVKKRDECPDVGSNPSL